MTFSIKKKPKTIGYLLATTSLGGITAVASLVYTSVLLYKNLPGLEQVRKLHLVTSGIILASLAVGISGLLLAQTNNEREERQSQSVIDSGIEILVFVPLGLSIIALLATLIGEIPLFAKAVQASSTSTMIAGLVLACLPVAMALISLVGWGIGANVEEKTNSRSRYLDDDCYAKVTPNTSFVSNNVSSSLYHQPKGQF